jgi:sugar phosphate isomerase/epimerase
MDLANELAVQSWCFRHFKQNENCIAQVKASGLDRIELSAAHVDFAKPETFDAVIGLYQRSGVRIVSIGAVGFDTNAAAMRNYFEFLRKAGTRFIAVMFRIAAVPEAYRLAERLAEEYDVRLGIHNHGGRHWQGSAEILAHVFAHTSPRIGLCLDTAWALDSGEDPVAMAERFGERLYGLHLKDFVFDRARRPKDVVVGTGNLDLGRLKQTLAKVRFDGIPVLEYEGDVENPTPAVRQCAEAVRKAMKA